MIDKRVAIVSDGFLQIGNIETARVRDVARPEAVVDAHALHLRQLRQPLLDQGRAVDAVHAAHVEMQHVERRIGPVRSAWSWSSAIGHLWHCLPR